MKTILFGGNSLHNKSWVQELEKNIKSIFSETIVHYYKHWDNPENSANVGYESQKVVQEAKDFKEYVFIAKSIGTYITLNAIDKGAKPSKLVFLGFPLSMDYRKDLLSLISKVKIPILFMQNEFDPFCSYKELKKEIESSGLKDFRIYCFKANDTHDYREYDKIKQLIQEFI